MTPPSHPPAGRLTTAPRPSRHRPVISPRPGQLFTRSDALHAGWTDRAMQCAVRGGRVERVRRGVYTAALMPPPSTPAQRRDELLRRGLAAAAISSDTVLSHAAAAISYGLPVVCPLDRPCLTTQRGSGMRGLAEVHLHRALLAPGDTRVLGPIQVTAPARTVLDLAREYGVDAGIVAADAALRGRLITPADLARALEQCAHWPGRAAARRVATTADPRAESPLESISRLRVADHHLAAPEPQVSLGDEHGRFIRRVDLYWPEFGVAGEADSNEKYDDDRAANRAEKWQQERLEDLGLVVVRWGWADLERFELVAQRLARAFARGVPAGAGQRWSVLRLHPYSA